MATFKICTFEHHQREDGTFPISIRVTWKRQSAYLKTDYRVSKKQLTKTFELKDAFLLRELNNRIAAFEDLKVQKLGLKIEQYTAKDLVEFFSKSLKSKGDDIDFIAFGQDHIKKLEKEGHKTYAGSFRSTVNALIDFFGRDNVSINQVTAKSIAEFESFLKTERTMKRLDQYGREYNITSKPLKDTTIYLRNIRTLFNLAIDHFNDEDRGEVLISHYPFKKFKIKKENEPDKRNLSIEQIRMINSFAGVGRMGMARDVFMLSFLMVGMNLADLYSATDIKNGRISYKRQKTKDRRMDNAFISIKLEPEVLGLIEKYKDPTGGRAFRFYQIYSDSHIFLSNINKGLKQLSSALNLDIPLSTYYARHSWATIARNDCRISKDDVHLALNHVDEKTKITDVYIARDWSIVDDANRKVIDLLVK